MMKRLFAVAALTIAALVGCATTPQTPAQAVYQAHGSYLAALSVAVKYRQLPPCETAPKPACSDRATVIKIQQADDAAYGALSAAQALARLPSTGDKAGAAVAAATQAVAAFSSLVTALGVK